VLALELVSSELVCDKTGEPFADFLFLNERSSKESSLY